MFICPSCKSGYESGEAFCPEDGTRLVSQSQIAAHPIANDPLVGAVLADRWKLIRPIGSGGMGVVYEAHHTTLGKRCAVKVLREQVSRDADVVQRFQREAQSASRIGHENIIEIIDFGITPGGASYMVMELLEGRDLADILLQRGAMSIERAIPILLQCCRALGAAHAKGIVHRDIKPENVFLIDREEHKDFVKIVDFGIAKISDLETPGAPGRKLTKTGMIFGTPEYMSTEQAYGRPTDARSDIYGLGVIAYEMFTGRVPFEGETFMAVISQHMLDPPPPMREKNPSIQIPADLEAIIVRTMDKDPDARPQSMAELHDQLLAFLGRAGLGHVVPERLANISFSTAPPPVTAKTQPMPKEKGAPVEARPTPRRSDLTPGPLALDDEPERPPPVSGGAPWGAIAAVVVVVLVGVGAVGLARPDLLGMAEGEAEDPDASAGTVTPVAPVNDTPDGAPQVVAVAESDEVDVRIDTEPAGASLKIDGVLLCPSTPCTVPLVPEATVVVELEHADRTTRHEVTAPAEDGEVQIEIPSAEDPHPRPTMRGMRRGGRRSSDVSADDLINPYSMTR
jgi:serine/threonine-protein kinase